MNTENTSEENKPKEKWIETKREFVIDEFGNERPVKVTRELDKPEPEKSWWTKHKDAIDNSIKLIGLVSISVPFILFYFQQKAENERQKGLRQLDVYSNASIELHSFLYKFYSIEQNDSFQAKFFYDTYPRIMFLHDTSIIRQFDSIKPKLAGFIYFRKILPSLTHLESICKFILKNIKRKNNYDSLMRIFYRCSDSTNHLWWANIEAVTSIDSLIFKNGKKERDSVAKFLFEMSTNKNFKITDDIYNNIVNCVFLSGAGVDNQYKTFATLTEYLNRLDSSFINANKHFN